MTEIQTEQQNKPLAKHLKDYQKPDFSVKSVYLTFELHDTQTIVTAEMELIRECSANDKPLVLNGERLKLIEIELNDQKLSREHYQLTDKTLTIPTQLNHLKIKTIVEINPLANTYLDGLYISKGMFCSQNEPEGFRKITYFLDRPDVMTTYTTKIIANKAQYPVLLSNGNKIEFGDLENGKHFVVWHDPFKKPSYLFALVAGDLACIEDQYVRSSGKPVKLEIYCEKGSEGKCEYAMVALKKSMRWDEQVFDLEYDLDIFMIVAVEAFNAGAMENKGLNIFNISCILADQATATDDNFIRVEKVIAHEYFHNWTGDRVTLRDWFQLTLKEGLTVFRDQEFTSDMHSRPVHRIENVSILRTHQFSEDAGPTAHPIRPASYIEMNNFYTTTVYDKGSEIIRMVHTLIGKENFFKGMKKYFELYDGQAITCDDFIHAMELAAQKDLSQFKRWYEQKGTPHLKVSFHYDPVKREFSLLTEQSNPKEGEKAPPLHFPLKIGLLSPSGDEYNTSKMLEIKDKKQQFVFQNIDHHPFVSLNRDFSAPIILESPLKFDDYLFLMKHDTNDFNRWEASQEIAMQIMLGNINKNEKLSLDPKYLASFQSLLLDDNLDDAFKALVLNIPSESLMSERQTVIQFSENHRVREDLKIELGKNNEKLFLEIYHRLNQHQSYVVEAKEIGRRKLKNCALSYLGYSGNETHHDLIMKQFKDAKNMTDQFAALSILNRIASHYRQEALSQFYDQWKHDPLVITKWLSLQASSPLQGAVERVKAAIADPVFNYKIPNLVRALIGSFFENHIHFHAIDGSGYALAEEQISHIDEINPSVAARLSAAFRKFPKLDKNRQEKLKASLEALLNKKNLSKNAYEMISKSLDIT